MRNYLKEIREKTSGMGRKEACSYIFTYYWYHMLGIAAAAALIFLFAVHYGFGNKKPVFTCVIVNQVTDGEEDLRLRDDFAGWSGLQKERIVIDSSYLFSYGDLRMEGTNESSYEKFFFQWRNRELDAVIVPESFYRHCKGMGGSFHLLEEREITEAGSLPYMDEGECRAVLLSEAGLMEKITGRQDEKLLLAFPETGELSEESKSFLKYMCGERPQIRYRREES